MNAKQGCGRLWMAVAAVCVMAAAAHAERPAHGRISYDAEGTYILGRNDADWSHATLNSMVLDGDVLWVDEANLCEIELAVGTYLRMADLAKVEVIGLDGGLGLRAWTGSFYLHRLRESAGNYTFETPAARVSVPANSLVRVDIEETGGTTVFVLSGVADIQIGAEYRQTLGDGLQMYIEPGHLGSQTLRFDGLDDDFDTWNRERVTLLATGFRSGSDRVEFAGGTLGVAELAAHGRWVDVRGEMYWQPEAALEYVPYRDGYWTQVAGCGDVWVGRYPFEYTTCHYGRWTYVQQYGWLWRYEAQWGPAWVAAVKYGPSLVWSPLGLDNRPVHVSVGGTFRIGDFTFSLAASSFAPVERVYYGYEVIQPVRVDLLPRVETRDIQIWNIDINNVVVGSLAGGTSRYALYKSSPGHGMRGLASVGKGKPVAREAVQVLSKSIDEKIAFNSRASVARTPSALPTGREKRAVTLEAHAKSPATPAGPGRGAGIRAKSAPEAATGRSGVKPSPSEVRTDRGGPPDKGQDRERGGPPDAGKDTGRGGPPDAGKDTGRGGAPDAGKDTGRGGPPDAGKDTGRGGSPGAGKGSGRGEPPDPGKDTDRGGPPSKAKPSDRGGAPSNAGSSGKGGGKGKGKP